MIAIEPDPGTAPERVVRPSRAVPGVVRRAAAVPPRWEAFRSCVADRESSGSPHARNPTSSAQGRYQFLDSQWRHGLAHMVAARLEAHGWPRREALRLRAWLRARPIAEWPAVHQDVGFAAVLAHPGGWRHWSLPGSRCQGLVP